VTVVKADEVEVKPFLLQDFIQIKEIDSSMKKVSKKELKNLAESLGMTYTDEQIIFTKKLITAYHNTYSEKR
jgi:hypothetical protein